MRSAPVMGLLCKIVMLLIITFGVSSCKFISGSQSKRESGVSQDPPKTDPITLEELKQGASLFDKESLGQWEITDYGGQGEVYVYDDAIYMEVGSNMTGINWTGPILKTNYELTLEAMRVDGFDFFCGLTFPVGENHCSLILGGWGGGLVGLSSIDGYDASNNETTQVLPFEDDRWYHVRLHVTPDRILVWFDDEEIINVVTTGRTINTRAEVYLSKPLGIGAVRNIYMRSLDEGE